MHTADYIALGFLIACMLLAGANVFSVKHHDPTGGKRRE